MQNDIKLLDIMLRDQHVQKGLYHPGPYWKSYVSRTTKAIRSDGLENFRSNVLIGKGYADVVPIHALEASVLDSYKMRLYKQIIELPFFKRYFVDPYIKFNELQFKRAQQYKDLYYTNVLADWFTQFSKKYRLPDTLVCNPQEIISINNYKIGHSYLTSFLSIYNLSKVIDFSKVESVFEIGGGFGAFAHTLLHCFPNIKKYLYLDIPPMLYVGTQYLKHFFKDMVIDYSETRSSNSIHFSSSKLREIIAVCPWQIEKVNVNIDFFWNSASFQEMTKEMVINYTQHIERMLKNNDSKLCLYAYKRGNPERILLPKELCQTIENNTFFEFKELEPEVEILSYTSADGHYFLGQFK